MLSLRKNKMLSLAVQVPLEVSFYSNLTLDADKLTGRNLGIDELDLGEKAKERTPCLLEGR